MNRPRLLAVWTALCALVVCAALSACASESEPESTEPGKLVEYTVRGRVVDVGDDPVNGPTVRVQHEPIPSFESEGKVVGMHAMTMPFPLAEGVDATALAPETIIELTFQVRYGAETQLAEAWELTKYDVLPPETELIFNGDDDVQTPDASETPEDAVDAPAEG